MRQDFSLHRGRTIDHQPEILESTIITDRSFEVWNVVAPSILCSEVEQRRNARDRR